MSPGGDGSVKVPEVNRLRDAWENIKGARHEQTCVNLECVRRAGSSLPAIVMRHPKLRLVLRLESSGHCVESIIESMEKDCMGDPKWVEGERFNSAHPITQMLCAELGIDASGKPKLLNYDDVAQRLDSMSGVELDLVGRALQLPRNEFYSQQGELGGIIEADDSYRPRIHARLFADRTDRKVP